MTRLYLCFDQQLKMLRRSTEDKVQAECKKLEGKDLDLICDKVDTILSSLLKSKTESFNAKAEALVFEDWGLKVESHKADLHANVTACIQNCKQRILDKLATTA